MKIKKLSISKILGLAEKADITQNQVLTVINHMPAANEERFDDWKKAVTGLRWHNFSVDEIVAIVEKIDNSEQMISDVVLDIIPWPFLKKIELEKKLDTETNTSVIAHIVSSGKIEQAKILSTLKKHNDDLEILIHAINSKKLSKGMLKKIGNKFQKAHIWQTIVLTERFTEIELLNIGKKANDNDVWIAIIKTSDLNEKQLRTILNYTQDEIVKAVILKHGDFDFQERQLIEN